MMKKGTIFITIGILLIAGSLGLVLYNLWDGYRAETASNKVMVQLTAAIEDGDSEPADEALDQEIIDQNGGTDAEEDQSLGELYPEREMPTITVDGYRYIGYISVPNLDLTLPVMEEWDYTRLKISPCRYSGNIYQNNLIIAGHNYARHFSRLKWEEVGTEVIFTDTEGYDYHYQISVIETLKPTQTVELEDNTTTPWDLTLFTCNTGGQTRCVIRCTKIDE